VAVYPTLAQPDGARSLVSFSKFNLELIIVHSQSFLRLNCNMANNCEIIEQTMKASTLCTLCWNIFQDSDILEKLKKDENVDYAHHTLSDLRDCADKGCKFCSEIYPTNSSIVIRPGPWNEEELSSKLQLYNNGHVIWKFESASHGFSLQKTYSFKCYAKDGIATLLFFYK
jgi:hypothetical protein